MLIIGITTNVTPTRGNLFDVLASKVFLHFFVIYQGQLYLLLILAFQALLRRY